MTLPPRRHKNSGRQNDGKRSQAHLQWVRGHNCLCAGASSICYGKIVAAHVDYAGGKGMGMKVSDVFTVPLCAFHHAEQHSRGWPEFEKKYGIKAKTVAIKLARQSPHAREMLEIVNEKSQG